MVKPSKSNSLLLISLMNNVIGFCLTVLGATCSQATTLSHISAGTYRIQACITHCCI